MKKQCSVENCAAPAYCRGLCSRCYLRDLKNGSLLAAPKILPGAKLTAEQVHMIRKLWAEGVRQYVLAERFGVTGAAISMAVNGRTWGDLKTTYVLTSMASPGPQRSSLRRGLAGPGSRRSRKLESAFPSAPALTRIDGRSDVGTGA